MSAVAAKGGTANGEERKWLAIGVVSIDGGGASAYLPPEEFEQVAISLLIPMAFGSRISLTTL
jgi:hypothetical protein